MADQVFQQGTIVWITAADSHGNRKRRPVVIITSNEDLAARAKIVGVAVTTTFSEPPPQGHVEIPWDATGRARTGLRRRSAAVCNWLVTFEAEDIDSVIGHVPAATLLAILQALPSGE